MTIVHSCANGIIHLAQVYQAPRRQMVRQTETRKQ